MSFRIKALLLCLFFLHTLWGQQKKNSDLLLAPVQQSMHYGLKDHEGKIIIPARFEELIPSASKIHRAREKGKWGFVDATGNWLVKPFLEEAGDMIGGCAVAALLDTANKFSQSLIFRRNQTTSSLVYGIIDKNGNWKIKPTYKRLILCEKNLVLFTENNLWGVMKTDGTILTPAKYSVIFPYRQGSAVMVLRDKNEIGILEIYTGGPTVITGGKWGLLGSNGKELIPPKYAYISKLSDGLATFNEGGSWDMERRFDDTKALQYGKWGCIDVVGQVVLPATYDSMDDFEDGTTKVSSGDSTFYINHSGKKIPAPPKTGEVDDDYTPSETYCEPAAWGFIDTSGKMIIPPAYGDARPFQEGFAAVSRLDSCEIPTKASETRKRINDSYDVDVDLVPPPASETDEDESWSFINPQGKLLVEYQFTEVGDFSEGLASVCQEGAWGFIDREGNWVIKPKYDTDTQHEYQFKDGLALIRYKGLWGFIDKTGKQVVPAVYDKVEEFSEGLAAVEVNGKWGFVDRTGHFVIKPQFSNVGTFSQGLCMARLRLPDFRVDDCGSDCKYGFIDTKGNWVVPPAYSFANDFSDGLAAVSDFKGGETVYGYVNTSGSLVIPLQYGNAWSFKNGLAFVSKSGVGVYIDKTGRVVLTTKQNGWDQPKESNYFGGLAVSVGPGGLFGFRNMKRKWVIEPVYQQVNHYSNVYKND
jgi:hypothetical protein